MSIVCCLLLHNKCIVTPNIVITLCKKSVKWYSFTHDNTISEILSNLLFWQITIMFQSQMDCILLYVTYCSLVFLILLVYFELIVQVYCSVCCWITLHSLPGFISYLRWNMCVWLVSKNSSITRQYKELMSTNLASAEQWLWHLYDLCSYVPHVNAERLTLNFEYENVLG